MQQNSLIDEQLELLDNIKNICENLKYVPWHSESKNILQLDKTNVIYLKDSLDKIVDSVYKIKSVTKIDPVFKEFLDAYDANISSDYLFGKVKESPLLKKLIEKVITLEKAIEELK